MARYYNSRHGSFCSDDPVEGDPNDPQSWDGYVYARDNPVNVTDPSGKFFQFLLALFAWIIDAIGQAIMFVVHTLFFTSSALGADSAADYATFVQSAMVGPDGVAFDISGGTMTIGTGAMTVSTTNIALFAGAVGGGIEMQRQPGGPPNPAAPQPVSLKDRLKDDLKKPDCNKLLGGQNNADSVLRHFKGTVVDPRVNGIAIAATPAGTNGLTQDFQVLVPTRGDPQSFLHLGPSAQETIIIHEFMHAVFGANSKLANWLIDQQLPYPPGGVNPRLTANAYEIAKNCGTALPPGF